MRRTAGALLLGCVISLLGTGDAAVAQGWPPWAKDIFGPQYHYAPRGQVAPEPPFPQEWTNEVRDGGARPAIAPTAPPVVSFPHGFPANSIVIVANARKLYYVLADKQAYEYSIGVGREGFNWTGAEKVSRKQAWPDWYPPAEMRARDPRLPVRMTGGIRNPLGAMALYLGNSLYRIHGTNDPKSIGRAESSGCFRMLNSDVLHLASITEIGTPVAVVSALPGEPDMSRVPGARVSPVSAKAAEGRLPPQGQ